MTDYSSDRLLCKIVKALPSLCDIAVSVWDHVNLLRLFVAS